MFIKSIPYLIEEKSFRMNAITFSGLLLIMGNKNYLDTLKTISFWIFFSISTFSFSQDYKNDKFQHEEKNLLNSQIHDNMREENRLKELRDKWDNAVGTFQIQIINSRISPQIDVSIIEQIENSRKEFQIVYIPIIEHVRVMILPFSLINEADFKKIKLFEYVSE